MISLLQLQFVFVLLNISSLMFQPQFLNLSEIWSGFQDEMVLLSVLTNILNNLDAFTRNHRNLFTDEVLAPILDQDEVKVRSDTERKEEVSVLSEEFLVSSFSSFLLLVSYSSFNCFSSYLSIG